VSAGSRSRRRRRAAQDGRDRRFRRAWLPCAPHGRARPTRGSRRHRCSPGIWCSCRRMPFGATTRQAATIAGDNRIGARGWAKTRNASAIDQQRNTPIPGRPRYSVVILLRRAAGGSCAETHQATVRTFDHLEWPSTPRHHGIGRTDRKLQSITNEGSHLLLL
jgi:hypothetical protein